ncbi:SDR family oxidoreductase [Agrococcus sp. HG114]|uniref:SDR family oxidoreductase n=1 Tax=Agrococcus sp. HG114 TaxID=2969757 RepID=UPI00215AE68D|nr:SDR family oxidoreductase [Agrococcus sp. HG114]MCR8670830.1 SDR family oxidoreductase [Agrococcus sp. HG114]
MSGGERSSAARRSRSAPLAPEAPIALLPEDERRSVLVTGATGYIGGRLIPRLVAAGHRVRALARDPGRLADASWAEAAEVVRGDLEAPSTLAAAFEGREVVYHLVHAMSAGGDFRAAELEQARNVAAAARAAGVRRIVYLSGLHPEGEPLSKHLASRVAVGETLLASGVPTIVLEAGIVIGSGSASFEMIRHLTEVLPYMPAPRWVRNFVQPIAVRDVLHYLVRAATVPDDVHGAFDIGGPDVLRYGQVMNGYALEAGLPQRPIAPLPVLTPWLASQWVNLVTPVPRAIAMPLIGSLLHDCVVEEHRIDAVIPPPPDGLIGYRQAVRLALVRERSGDIESSWRSATIEGAPSDPLPSDPKWSGSTVFEDARERVTDASPEAVWRVIESIGGERGWYSVPLLWSVRGLADRVAGGVGLRRGRRDPDRLREGDVVDWWRVERIDRGRLLRLRAEMRVPGRAWIEFEVTTRGTGAHYRQRAVFLPSGLSGRLYWWALVPAHLVIFDVMANRIVAAAEGGRR